MTAVYSIGPQVSAYTLTAP